MNRWDEAREILGLLYDDDPHQETINREIEDIRMAPERAGKGNISAMFKMGPQRTIHRVAIAATAQVFSQMNGVNSIVYYASTIFRQQLRFNLTTSRILAAASFLVVVLGSICCAWTVDRFGRRKLMLSSAAAMSVCFACLAGVTSQPNNPAALKARVFFIYLYYFVFALGFMGLPFLYASEIAPAHLRAANGGLSTAVLWLCNFIVVEVTPVAFNNIGWKYFLVYFCLNGSFVPIVYFFFPETARRSLEDINEIFESSRMVFYPGSMAEKSQ
jgi:MFS family permease